MKSLAWHNKLEKSYFLFSLFRFSITRTSTATETISKNICLVLFFRSTFFWIFTGNFICSPNRYQFSRRICLFAEQILFFQESFLCVHRTDTGFPGARFWLPNRYRFSRSPFLTTKQIPIFHEAFFEYQRTDRQFPKEPPPNRYFSNSSRWLLRRYPWPQNQGSFKSIADIDSYVVCRPSMMGGSRAKKNTITLLMLGPKEANWMNRRFTYGRSLALRNALKGKHRLWFSDQLGSGSSQVEKFTDVLVYA